MRIRSLALVFVACGGGAASTAQPILESPPPSSSDEPPAVEEARAAPTAPAPADPVAAALLEEHNRYRAQHCSPALTWSPRLAQVAQRWANSLRDQGCAFEHSGGKYGENLAGGTAGTLDPAAVVGMWYDEVAKYNFSRGGFSMSTGHFTQVVWRDTTEVGCGKATCRGEDTDLWVCNYSPPGNVQGGYRDNVHPKGCKSP